jgi:hypothetical protein
MSAVREVDPPAISTLPSLRRVAVWKDRGVLIPPIVIKTPEEALYNSALANFTAASALAHIPSLAVVKPPAIRVDPSGSTVDVW